MRLCMQSCRAPAAAVRFTEERERSMAHTHSRRGPAGLVEFEDVHFEYQPGYPLLRGISFSVEAGQAPLIACERSAALATLCLLS